MTDIQPDAPADEPVQDPQGVDDQADPQNGEVLSDDERTVRRLLAGASNPIGDVERGAAGLEHKHLHEGQDDDFTDPADDH